MYRDYREAAQALTTIALNILVQVEDAEREGADGFSITVDGLRQQAAVISASGVLLDRLVKKAVVVGWMNLALMAAAAAIWVGK